MIVPADGDSFAREVAAAYAASTKSVVTFVAITQLDAHGGPLQMHSFSETAYEEADGAPVRKRVLRAVDDGKTADPPELAKRSVAPDSPSSRFGMRLPIYQASVGEYTYSKPREDGDTIVVDFVATIRDEAHGDGTLTYFEAENRIEKLVIRPCVLPAHANSMTTTMDFGRVSDDRWDVVRITHTFTGHMGPISGGGASITTYERYHPFPTETAAEAALSTMEASSG
jgi:hypothetical protein